VSILLRNCPHNYQGHNYEQDCVEPLPNIAFGMLNLAVDAEEPIMRTDANGQVSFVVPYTGSDVVLIEEQAPQNVVQMVVTSCEQDGQEFTTPFVPAYFVTEAGNIELRVPSGSEITCTWVN